MAAEIEVISALVPRDESGCQFVCYADACSGVAGAPHEKNFAAINAVIRRLRPQPEFICFPGDEIQGLSANPDVLRQQWHYWFSHEMSWLDREVIPLYHTTANHTTYDRTSELVFREVLSHLPRNGPTGEEGLAYFVRRGDLLMVFVNTMFSGRGGEGRVEIEWLEKTLTVHSDAKYKLVFGHHPVHSVNGFSGPYQRDIEPVSGHELWRILVKHGVLAYFCSHILAFDVQVHDGVLQLLTAGAGTADRMPEGIEYLHCVQAAIDAGGLRYQVLDATGAIRESLHWPLSLPPSSTWNEFNPRDVANSSQSGQFTVWKFTGVADSSGLGEPQTLICGWQREHEHAIPPFWIGLQGPEQRVCVLFSQAPGRSPHLWLGHTLSPGSKFKFQLAIHTGMGPGGVLWRENDHSPWSSLRAASPWGAERVSWPNEWSIGHAHRGCDDQPFRGAYLKVNFQHQATVAQEADRE